MQVPGGDILWLELMSGGKETLLKKMEANGTMFECSFIFSENFISEWTLSLTIFDSEEQYLTMIYNIW